MQSQAVTRRSTRRASDASDGGASARSGSAAGSAGATEAERNAARLQLAEEDDAPEARAAARDVLLPPERRMSRAQLNEVLAAFPVRWLKSSEIYMLLHSYRQFGLRVRTTPEQHPPSGSWFLYAKGVKVRADGYEYQRKTDTHGYNVIREHHVKLQVGGVRVLSCYYSQRDDKPTFSRRIYWLLDSEFEGIDDGDESAGSGSTRSSTEAGAPRSGSGAGSASGARSSSRRVRRTRKASPSRGRGDIDPGVRGTILVHYLDPSEVTPEMAYPALSDLLAAATARGGEAADVATLGGIVEEKPTAHSGRPVRRELSASARLNASAAPSASPAAAPTAPPFAGAAWPAATTGITPLAEALRISARASSAGAAGGPASSLRSARHAEPLFDTYYNPPPQLLPVGTLPEPSPAALQSLASAADNAACGAPAPPAVQQLNDTGRSGVAAQSLEASVTSVPAPEASVRAVSAPGRATQSQAAAEHQWPAPAPAPSSEVASQLSAIDEVAAWPAPAPAHQPPARLRSLMQGAALQHLQMDLRSPAALPAGVASPVGMGARGLGPAIGLGLGLAPLPLLDGQSPVPQRGRAAPARGTRSRAAPENAAALPRGQRAAWPMDSLHLLSRAVPTGSAALVPPMESPTGMDVSLSTADDRPAGMGLEGDRATQPRGEVEAASTGRPVDAEDVTMLGVDGAGGEPTPRHWLAQLEESSPLVSAAGEPPQQTGSVPANESREMPLTHAVPQQSPPAYPPMVGPSGTDYARLSDANRYSWQDMRIDTAAPRTGGLFMSLPTAPAALHLHAPSAVTFATPSEYGAPHSAPHAMLASGVASVLPSASSQRGPAPAARSASSSSASASGNGGQPAGDDGSSHTRKRRAEHTLSTLYSIDTDASVDASVLSGAHLQSPVLRPSGGPTVRSLEQSADTDEHMRGATPREDKSSRPTASASAEAGGCGASDASAGTVPISRKFQRLSSSSGSGGGDEASGLSTGDSRSAAAPAPS